MRRKFLAAGLAAMAALAPAAAVAHTGQHPPGAAFQIGFLHPLTGLDHLLAMVAVGLWAGALGGAARWIVPASFVALMCVGAVFGIGGVFFPAVETVIAASVAVLGFAIAVDARPPAPVAAGLVGLFALFHGHAHGAELPPLAAALAYVAGFVLTTALLHAAGLCLGAGLRLNLGDPRGIAAPLTPQRLAGGALAVAGAGLLAGF